MNQINQIISFFSGTITGPVLVVVLLFTGIFLTFKLGFIQLFYLPKALKLVFQKKSDQDGDISQFQALMTALAATIGTGNIIGVATAIAIGGPGALFWMWVSAFLGMATRYSEAFLAVKYREKNKDGQMSGGPMYYLLNGVNSKPLAYAFAFFGAFAAFGIGNLVQANSIAKNIVSMVPVETYHVGIILMVSVGAIIIGGIKQIGKASGFIVPFMAIIYVIACVLVLLFNLSSIPAAFAQIFKGAFSGTAAVGGFVGSVFISTLQIGVTRGIFSNESGLGSAPIAAAAAQTKNPQEQALVSMTGTFIDTLVICTMTGLAIVLSGVWNSGISPALMTKLAFENVLSQSFGGILISLSITLFAFSTLLGWFYYGEKCFEFLFKDRFKIYYKILWVVSIGVGSVAQLSLVWSIADIMNALMAFPNLIALIILQPIIVRETKKYLGKS